MKMSVRKEPLKVYTPTELMSSTSTTQMSLLQRERINRPSLVSGSSSAPIMNPTRFQTVSWFGGAMSPFSSLHKTFHGTTNNNNSNSNKFGTFSHEQPPRQVPNSSYDQQRTIDVTSITELPDTTMLITNDCNNHGKGSQINETSLLPPSSSAAVTFSTTMEESKNLKTKQNSTVNHNVTINAFLRNQTAKLDEKPITPKITLRRPLSSNRSSPTYNNSIQTVRRPSSANFRSAHHQEQQTPTLPQSNSSTQNSKSVQPTSSNIGISKTASLGSLSVSNNMSDFPSLKCEEIRPRVIKRMPVTGTLFYHKASKSEALLLLNNNNNNNGRLKPDGKSSENCSKEESSVINEVNLYQQIKKELELHRQQQSRQIPHSESQSDGDKSKSITINQQINKDDAEDDRESVKTSVTNTAALAKATTASTVYRSSGVGESVVARLRVTTSNGEQIAKVESKSVHHSQDYYSGFKPIRPMSALAGLSKSQPDNLDSFGERQPGDGEADRSDEELKAILKSKVDPSKLRTKSVPNLKKDNSPQIISTKVGETEEEVSTRHDDSCSDDDDDDDSSGDDKGRHRRLSARRKRPQSCTPKFRGPSVNSSSSSKESRRRQDDSEDDVESSNSKRYQELCVKYRKRSTSATPRRPSSATTNKDLKTRPGRKSSPLTYSLFPHVPPAINFVETGDSVEPLPDEYRKLLKWRLNIITPLIVKNTVVRSGFKTVGLSFTNEDLEGNESNDWIGYFGRHMRSASFKSIKEHQKVNHFPGSFQIGRKDRLWINLHRMQTIHGKKEFGFFPQTFVLPGDYALLKLYWDEGGGHKERWIIKPPASARGNGIRVINKWSHVPKKRSFIIQKYLSNPFLIRESKFDMRIYVYVSSFDPLRIYVHEDGLVRFASQKYSNCPKSIVNRFVHLTNYSINRYNTEYVANNDQNACTGHKWSLKALWSYFRQNNMNPDPVWDRIKDIIVKTVISAEASIRESVSTNCRRNYCVHELFGFDIILDDQLKPWILECNISPSLHSDSPLDIKVKGGMIKDMLNLAGYQLPDKFDIHPGGGVQRINNSDLNNYSPTTRLVTDRRLWNPPLLTDERAKQNFYKDQFRRENRTLDQSILDRLTPADIRCLVETFNEMDRAGSFQCLFPSANCSKYLRLFDDLTYNNILNCVYLQKYGRVMNKGIERIKSYCRKKIHFYSGAYFPHDVPVSHTWRNQESSQDEKNSDDDGKTVLRNIGSVN